MNVEILLMWIFLSYFIFYFFESLSIYFSVLIMDRDILEMILISLTVVSVSTSIPF